MHGRSTRSLAIMRIAVWTLTATLISGCVGIPISDGPMEMFVITGFVLDAKSGAPIAGARISGGQGRVDRLDGEMPTSTLTDPEGKFRVAGYARSRRSVGPLPTIHSGAQSFITKVCEGNFAVEKEGYRAIVFEQFGCCEDVPLCSYRPRVIELEK